MVGAVVLNSAKGDLSSNRVTIGKNISLAGLVSQVITMFIFILIAIDFGIRAWRHTRNLDDDATDSPYAHLHSSLLFRGFLVALSISTLCIFVRCVYRVAELSDGFDGRLAHIDWLFIVLEGVMVAIAVLVLNVFHPAVCFREGSEEDISTEMKGTKPSHDSKWRILG